MKIEAAVLPLDPSSPAAEAKPKSSSGFTDILARVLAPPPSDQDASDADASAALPFAEASPEGAVDGAFALVSDLTGLELAGTTAASEAPVVDVPVELQDTAATATVDSTAARAHGTTALHAGAFGAVTSDEMTSDAVAPDEVPLDEVAPDAVAPGDVAPDAVAPGDVAPGDVTPDAGAATAVAPGDVTPDAGIATAVAPGGVTSEEASPPAGWTTCASPTDRAGTELGSATAMPGAPRWVGTPGHAAAPEQAGSVAARAGHASTPAEGAVVEAAADAASPPHAPSPAQGQPSTAPGSHAAAPAATTTADEPASTSEAPSTRSSGWEQALRTEGGAKGPPTTLRRPDGGASPAPASAAHGDGGPTAPAATASGLPATASGAPPSTATPPGAPSPTAAPDQPQPGDATESAEAALGAGEAPEATPVDPNPLPPTEASRPRLGSPRRGRSEGAQQTWPVRGYAPSRSSSAKLDVTERGGGSTNVEAPIAARSAAMPLEVTSADATNPTNDATPELGAPEPPRGDLSGDAEPSTEGRQPSQDTVVPTDDPALDPTPPLGERSEVPRPSPAATAAEPHPSATLRADESAPLPREAPRPMSSSSASNTPHASDSAPSATSEPEVLDLERFEDLEHAFARLRPTPPGGATLEVQVGELGRLQIRVDPDGADGLKVAIAAEDPAVAQFLQSRRSEVLEAIASGDAGGDVELDIRQGARDGASGRGTEDEPERQAHRPGHPAHGNPAARRRPAAAPAPTTGSRLVDIVA